LIGMINKEVKEAGAHLLQQGDTLMLFKTGKDQKAEFHTFNAASAADLAKNGLIFFQVLKKLKYKGAYSDYENPLISKLFMTYIDPVYKVDITETKPKGYHVEVTL